MATQVAYPTTLKRISISNRRQVQEPDPPAVDIAPSGRSICNRQATAVILGMVDRQGIHRLQFVLEVAGDEFGRCALTPVPDHIIDGAKVTFYRNRGTMGFQLGDLFREYPDVRPVVRQRCSPTFTVTPEGKPCILLSLTLGRDNPTIPKTPKSK